MLIVKMKNEEKNDSLGVRRGMECPVHFSRHLRMIYTVCSPNRTLCKSTSETSLYRTDSWVPVASVIERLHHT